MKIHIKPLSVNVLFQGKKIKTSTYRSYETELFYKLPNILKIYKKNAISIHVGLSNKNADLDNVTKAFIDVLQKKYDFNDSSIYSITLEKHIVPKQQEYIKFSISEYLN